MKFKKVGWLKNAVATPRGFRHPKTGEMLKTVRLSPSDIVEWNGWEDRIPKECKVVVEDVVEDVVVVEEKECDCETCDGLDCDCDCHKEEKGFFSKLFS